MTKHERYIICTTSRYDGELFERFDDALDYATEIVYKTRVVTIFGGTDVDVVERDDGTFTARLTDEVPVLKIFTDPAFPNCFVAEPLESDNQNEISGTVRR